MEIIALAALAALISLAAWTSWSESVAPIRFSVVALLFTQAIELFRAAF